MKTAISPTIFIFIIYLNSSAQISIKLDGSMDKPFWSSGKNLIKTERVLWKEDAENYYLGITTPSNVFVNVFIKNKSLLTILHSSWGIGEARYQFENDTLATCTKSFSVKGASWYFMDPKNRKDTTKTDVTAELENCYAKYKWAASTVYLGKKGETEFVINKSLIPKGSEICITWDINLSLNYYPENSTITSNWNRDMHFHLGNSPSSQVFIISNWMKL